MALFRREASPEELQAYQQQQQAREAQAQARQQQQQAREAQAQARRERQVRVTAADTEEITSICQSALEAIDVKNGVYLGTVKVAVREAKLTRGGLIIRGSIRDKYDDHSNRAPQVMLTALTNLGFVVSDQFGSDGVIVTGWDPQHYEGDQLTSQRVRVRVRELQEVEQELVELEASQVQVRDF